MLETQFLYRPGTAPVRGMRSALDPAALVGGYYQLLQNLRFFRLRLTPRWGCLELTSGAVVGGASYRGHQLFPDFNGSEYMIAAYRVGAETQIYRVNHTANPITFAEISQAGPPNTRFATDGDVNFAIVRELGFDDPSFLQLGRDMIYITNGEDTPRALTGAGGGTIAVLDNIEAGDYAGGNYRPVPCGYMKINDNTNTGCTDSTGGARVTCADTGVAPVNEVSITINTTALVNDYADIAPAGVNPCVNIAGPVETAAGTLDGQRSDQAWLVLLDDAADPITNYCNLEVTQGGGQVTIYECTGANRLDPAQISLGGGYILVGISIAANLKAWLTPINGWRFVVKKAPTANRTFRVAGILLGGQIVQGCDYQFTFANTQFRQESRAIQLKAERTAALSEYGCRRTLSTPLPNDETLRYQYRIDCGWSAPAEADTVYIYRLEPGDVRHLHTQEMPVSAGPTCENTLTVNRTSYRPAPSLGARGPMAAKCCVSHNGRLILGSPPSKRSEYWVSDLDFPWRFNALATDEDGDGVPDPGSGLSKALPGEQLTAIREMPGSFVGVAPLILYGSEKIYRINGDDYANPTLMNEHGTIYARSIAEHQGVAHYLDNDLIARRFAGGIESEPLSADKIDDQLEAGDMAKCAAFVWKDRYGLAFRASGATINQRVGICDLREGAEWGLDRYTAAIQNWGGFSVQGAGSARRLMGFTEEGRIYQLERTGQLTDDGTEIRIRMTTGQLHQDFWTECFWGQIGVVADRPATPMVWTVTRSDPFDTANASSRLVGKIKLDDAPKSAVYRKDVTEVGEYPTGMDSPAAVYDIEGPYTPGLYIKAITYDVESFEMDRADVGAS